MVFGGRVGLRPEKLLGKQIPEGGYNMRKATSQKIKAVKYLLSVLWNKKVIELDCSTGSDRWLNWEPGDMIRGKAYMAGPVFSSVALPSGKIKLAAVYVRTYLNS